MAQHTTTAATPEPAADERPDGITMTRWVTDGPFDYEITFRFDGYKYSWDTGRATHEVWVVEAGQTPTFLWAPGDRYYQPLVVAVNLPEWEAAA